MWTTEVLCERVEPAAPQIVRPVRHRLWMIDDDSGRDRGPHAVQERGSPSATTPAVADVQPFEFADRATDDVAVRAAVESPRRATVDQHREHVIAAVPVSEHPLEAWSGHRDEARQALGEAFDLALGGDFTLSVGYAVAIGLRVEADAAGVARRNSAFGDEQVAIDRARSIVDRIQVLLRGPGPTDGWKREVSALALAAEAELTRALGAFDPDAWATAVSAWRALHMPYEVARGQYGQASALLGARTGREQATALLAEAAEVAARLGARPLADQVGALARRARIDIGAAEPETATHGLTGREREVLSLLASGATNRGIAGVLFISVKTAGVHVSNILRKLGVANRAEAISVAFRDDLVS